jgi:protein-S-isoprenylcysteine O-methyltransferase Ste14
MDAEREIPGRLRPSDAVVAVQFTALAGLLWPGRGRWGLPRPARRVAQGAVVAGTAASLLGLVHLGRDLTVRVRPRTGSTLHTSGAYAVTRNPVYAGLLLSSAGFAALRRRQEPLIAFFVLSGVLHIKALLEERQLRATFGAAYGDYAARVPRLFGMPRRRVGNGR